MVRCPLIMETWRFSACSIMQWVWPKEVIMEGGGDFSHSIMPIGKSILSVIPFATLDPVRVGFMLEFNFQGPKLSPISLSAKALYTVNIIM